MVTGPIERISTVPSTGKTESPGSMGAAGAFGWPRVRTICAACSTEIGNQPRMVHTASRTPATNLVLDFKASNLPSVNCMVTPCLSKRRCTTTRFSQKF